MTEDALNDLLVRAQLLQIRGDATTKCVQAVPLEAETFDDRTNLASQLIG